MNLFLPITLMALSLSLFPLFLKIGLIKKRVGKSYILWIFLSFLSISAFLLLLYDDLHYKIIGTWLFFPGAILLNLVYSILILKEPLTVTKTTAYVLILTGISLLYLPFFQTLF